MVVGGVVVVARGAGPHHPAVVGEGRQVLAQTAPCVPVAADEVGEEQEEEDRDYGVADGGAGLLREVVSGTDREMGLILHGTVDVQVTTTSRRCVLRSSSSHRSRSIARRRPRGGSGVG